MKKIILASLSFILIGGGVYSQQINPLTKDKKEVPQEQKDRSLPKPKEDEDKVKTPKPQVDSVKSNIDTLRK